MAQLPPPPQQSPLTNPDGSSSIFWLQWWNLVQQNVNTNSSTFAPLGVSYVITNSNSSLPGSQVLAALSQGFVKVNQGLLSSTGHTTIQPSDLSSTAVTAGNYTVNGIASYTVDANGRLTSSASPVITITGTTGTITVTGGAGATPTLTIASTYVGQTSITTVGTITSGTWNGAVLAGTYGGTGVNNGTKTLTYLKNISFTAADDTGVYTLPTGTKTLVPTSTDISSAGIVTKTNNVSFATSATTDTTNASNITSGTLPAARLPNPTSSTLGGIESIAAVSHNFLTSISTSGVPVAAQPADSDLSFTDITTNNVTTSAHGFAPKLPNDSTKFLNGVGSYAVPASGSGKLLQTVYTETGAVATGTTTYTLSDAVPQNTYGDQYMTLSITPASASSLLVIDVLANVSSSGVSGIFGIFLFQDSTANALASNWETTPLSNTPYVLSLKHTMVAGTTSATTFKIRIGSNGAATTTFNGAAGARYFGGTLCSTIRIQEVTA